MTPKPCPWCGNVDLSASESELPKYWAVHCGCGIHGPEVRVLIKATDDEKAKVAFEAWNNRPLDAPDATDVDLMLSACKIKIQRLQKIESVAIDIKYELSQQRVWAGMDWSYHHLRKERVKACFESLQKVTTADMPDKSEIAERLK